MITISWETMDYCLKAGTTLAAIYAAAKSRSVSKQVQEVHLSVNSRLEALLKATKEAATAEGHAAGLVQGQAQATRSVESDRAAIQPQKER